MSQDRRRTVQSAKPHANRRSAVKPAPRIAKPMPKPIMDDCDECCGEGQVQQRCEDCRIALDDDNLAVGAESYVCKTCFAQENGA
jgi:hypothetical protein